MKEYWEDTHIMYDEDDDKGFHLIDFIGGLIVCSMIFFCGYGMYSFYCDMFR